MLQDVEEDVLTLEKFKERKAQAELEEKEQQKLIFRGKKVLLVEDNALNREIARMLLKEMGFIIDDAWNGKEAYDKVRESESGEYSIVLMDIQMPIMDGYEATKLIRNLPNRAQANVPIIAMTANAFAEEKKNALACGMNAHVSKPIDVNTLFKTMENIIKE